MNKKYFLYFAFCSLVGFFVGISLNSSFDDDRINDMDAIGYYINYNCDGKESVLVLFDDLSCSYPGKSSVCRWKINNQKIKISLTTYILNINDTSFSSFRDKNSCEEYRNDVEKHYEKSSCIKKEYFYDAYFTGDGVILNDNYFKSTISS